GILSGFIFSGLIYGIFLLLNVILGIQGTLLTFVYWRALLLPKILSMLLLFIIGLPFHYLEAKWIFAQLVVKINASEESTTISLDYLRAVLLKFSPLLPFVVLIILLKFLGVSLGAMGTLITVLFTILMVSVITVTLSAVFLMNKQNFYSCAVFNAFVFAWVIIGWLPWY
ncbi:MAG: hypothetical protein ACFFBD_18615, partial [Candidatus Hodarchaeota archaeon]